MSSPLPSLPSSELTSASLLSPPPSSTTTFLLSSLLRHPRCQTERGPPMPETRGERQKDQIQFGDWHRVNNDVGYSSHRMAGLGHCYLPLISLLPALVVAPAWVDADAVWLRGKEAASTASGQKYHCSQRNAVAGAQIILWACSAFSPARSQKWAHKAPKLSTLPEACRNGNNWSRRNQDGGNVGPESQIT